jgi:hypothetical protein
MSYKYGYSDSDYDEESSINEPSKTPSKTPSKPPSKTPLGRLQSKRMVSLRQTKSSNPNKFYITKPSEFDAFASQAQTQIAVEEFMSLSREHGLEIGFAKAMEALRDRRAARSTVEAVEEQKELISRLEKIAEKIFDDGQRKHELEMALLDARQNIPLASADEYEQAVKKAKDVYGKLRNLRVSRGYITGGKQKKVKKSRRPNKKRNKISNYKNKTKRMK